MYWLIDMLLALLCFRRMHGQPPSWLRVYALGLFKVWGFRIVRAYFVNGLGVKSKSSQVEPEKDHHSTKPQALKAPEFPRILIEYSRTPGTATPFWTLHGTATLNSAP